MKILPSTQFPLLRWTLLVLVAGCVWLAIRDLQLAFSGELLYGVLALGLWVPLAIGLWLRYSVARWVAIVVLWVVAVAVPLGTVNPFAAMDELGPNPPPLWQLLIKVAPWVIGPLFAVHVLGKYKKEFRQQFKAAA